MAESFEALNMPSGIEQVLAEGIKVYPNDAALRLQLANHYYRADRAEDGLEILAPLLEKNPAVEILLTHASLLKAAGIEAEARACFETILRTHPDNVAALANLGDMRLDERDYKKSAALFEQALANDANKHPCLKQAGAGLFPQRRSGKSLAGQ